MSVEKLPEKQLSVDERLALLERIERREAGALRKAAGVAWLSVAIAALLAGVLVFGAWSQLRRIRTEVATLAGAVAGLAVVLAFIGLCGLLAYTVSCRTREIGIRVGVRAAPGAVVSMVLREGLVFTLGGLAIGLPAAFVATGALRTLMFGISEADPCTFAATTASSSRWDGGAVAVPVRIVSSGRLQHEQVARCARQREGGELTFRSMPVLETRHRPEESAVVSQRMKAMRAPSGDQAGD